jgi:hypothetical protein
MKLNDCRKNRHFDATPELRGAGNIREWEKASLIYVV